MVDVVHITFAATQLEHVLQRIDQILAAEGHNRFRNVLVEFAVDAEAPDPAKAITVLVEELFLEEGLRLVELRRVTGTQPGVNLQQRVLMLVVILGGSDVVFGQGIEDQRIGQFGDHLDVFEVARLDFVDGLADLGAGLDQFLAAFGIDDRRGCVVRGLELPDLDGFNLIKLTNDRLGGPVFGIEGPQEGCCRNLAALVDADGQGVFLGDRAFDPASAPPG